MELHLFVAFVAYLVPIIAIIAGPVLLIAGLILRKSKKKISKSFLIAGGICLGLCFVFLCQSIAASFLGGALSM